MALETFRTPNSSNVAGGSYDPETQELIVEFKGGAAYAYSGVDPGTAADLQSDTSPGSFLARHIKNRFPVRKL